MPFIYTEVSSGNHWMGNFVGFKASLNTVTEKRKISTRTGNRNPDVCSVTILIHDWLICCCWYPCLSLCERRWRRCVSATNKHSLTPVNTDNTFFCLRNIYKDRLEVWIIHAYQQCNIHKTIILSFNYLTALNLNANHCIPSLVFALRCLQ
jgi:hypothetical protein